MALLFLHYFADPGVSYNTLHQNVFLGLNNLNFKYLTQDHFPFLETKIRLNCPEMTTVQVVPFVWICGIFSVLKANKQKLADYKFLSICGSLHLHY